MLEIIVVIFLCRGIGSMMRNKGRSALPFQIMLVLFWIGGEILFPLAYGVIRAIQVGGEPEFGIEVYLIALAGAAIGAAVTFLIGSLVPRAQPSWESSPTDRRLSGGYYEGGPSRDPNNPYDPPRY